MESANLTRRTFLAGGFVAATVAVTGCASPLHDKTALHSSSAFIDTHTHFYDPSRPQGVPWPSKGDAVLYRTVLPAEYKRFAEALGVGGTVVVEASPWLEDNQFILDLAMDEPFILGLCGNLPPGENSFKQHLSRFTKNPLFRGIRISGDGWRSKVGEGRFLDDLRRLADADLQLDVNVDTRGLEDTARLADRSPTLRIVLDHCGNTVLDGNPVKPDWLAGMSALGGRKNVYAKLSGLVEGTDKRNADAPANVDFYRPVLDAMWAIFGENRLIYGSNWPVSSRFANLATVQGIVRLFVESKGSDSVKKVFRENARSAYQPVFR